MFYWIITLSLYLISFRIKDLSVKSWHRNLMIFFLIIFSIFNWWIVVIKKYLVYRNILGHNIDKEIQYKKLYSLFFSGEKALFFIPYKLLNKTIKYNLYNSLKKL